MGTPATQATDPGSHFDPAKGAASLRPIVGPSVWLAADVQDDREWRHTFTAAELDELLAAARETQQRGIELIDVGPDNFRLPTLGARMERLLHDLLHGRGFSVLRGLPVERLSREESARIYLGVGSYIGHPVPQNAAGHVLGHVRDLGYDHAQPHVRVYQTRERQTYHTDSCDVVGLLCLKHARSGGLSTIASSMAIYNEMLRTRPDLAVEMFTPVATDRRGEVPEGMQPCFMLAPFNEYQGHLSVIYARTYIKSAQRFPDVPRLSEAQVEAMDLFDALAEDDRFHLDMELQPGDMQFICNHTVLHDRTKFEDWDEPERKRHLLRLWLSPREGRPLPPAYAQRYGSVEIGARGGIRVAGQTLCAPLEP